MALCMVVAGEGMGAVIPGGRRGSVAQGAGGKGVGACGRKNTGTLKVGESMG